MPQMTGNTKKIRFIKLSSELNDGVSSWILHEMYLETPNASGLLGALKVFLDESEVGDTFTGELVEMLESDYNDLPEAG